MAKTLKANAKPRARSRMRSEIVEAMRGLRKVGAVTDGELEKTTLRMLGRDALPKVEAMSPAEIAAALTADSAGGRLLRETRPVFGKGLTSRDVADLIAHADAPTFEHADASAS